MIITSVSNEKIKKLRSLYRDRKNRYLYGEYIAEGVTMVKDLDPASLKEVYIKQSKADALVECFPAEKTIIVKDEIFDKVADAKTPSGVIATVSLPDSKTVVGDIAVMLCGLSDAGNVGTIIRTACAAGIKTVVCVNSADPYSPKSVRASMGAIAKQNIIETDYNKALQMLADYKIITLDMDGICIYDYRLEGKSVIAVGNEAHGIPDEIRLASDVRLNIPMAKDGVESLNAAVASSIAMYLLQAPKKI